MSYRINYGPPGNRQRKRSGTGRRLRIMTAGMMVLFVLATEASYPEGKKILEEFLLPDQTVSETPFLHGLSSYRRGTCLEDCFLEFCREVIRNGTQN